MKSDIAALREEYTLASLRESDVDSNPIILFQEWFQEGIIAEIQDLNAMTLATADAFGKPHARMVLLKDLEENQFTFFTNYNSHKGQELFANPFASLLFHWKELQRQIRIEGEVSKISEEASTQYFHSRPVESQLGAWASHQSEILHTRDELENRMKKLQEQYQNLFLTFRRFDFFRCCK